MSGPASDGSGSGPASDGSGSGPASGGSGGGPALDGAAGDRAGDGTASGADPLDVLRRATRARVALGRAGDALPTARLLELRAAHAAARDAVHTPLDAGAVADRIAGELGLEVLRAASAAPGRADYLRRPDLGRRLADGVAADLAAAARPGADRDTGYDVVPVVADGLSPPAVGAHAVPMLGEIVARLDGWRIAPVVVATQARVALGDEIATAVRARSVVVLVGERPGMSSTDSLGIYFTWDAHRGRRDSERNCLSNVRPPHGTGYPAAAATLVMLMAEARRLGLSGVNLKADPALPS